VSEFVLKEAFLGFRNCPIKWPSKMTIGINSINGLGKTDSLDLLDLQHRGGLTKSFLGGMDFF
jgi:hypothetical protein